MHRISAALVAALVFCVIGCGDEPQRATPGTGTQATGAPVTPAPSVTAAPPDPASAITVRRAPSDSTAHYRAGGRSWSGCGATVYDDRTGFDWYGVSVSGPVKCTTAIAVFKALANYVHQHQTATDDCFPGYCNADGRSRTTIAGYGCKATDYGDVSISLDIVCRRGDRHVSAGAADDE